MHKRQWSVTGHVIDAREMHVQPSFIYAVNANIVSQKILFCLNRPVFSPSLLKLFNTLRPFRIFSRFVALLLSSKCLRHHYSLTPSPCTPLFSSTLSSLLLAPCPLRPKRPRSCPGLLSLACLPWQISRFRGSQATTVTTKTSTRTTTERKAVCVYSKFKILS